MEYLVNSCTRQVGDKVISVCGGWCCYKLDFSQFPNGKWFGECCPSLVNGVCVNYEDRPLACEGAPFYDGSFEEYPSDKFIVPWCCFRKPVFDRFRIPYEILPSGDDCIIAYTEQGLGDFIRWQARKFFRNQTIFWR